MSDIPDLFDIGLSKETLRRFIGLKSTVNPDPEFGTYKTLNIVVDSKTTEYEVGDINMFNNNNNGTSYDSYLVFWDTHKGYDCKHDVSDVILCHKL